MRCSPVVASVIDTMAFLIGLPFAVVVRPRKAPVVCEKTKTTQIKMNRNEIIIFIVLIAKIS